MPLRNEKGPVLTDLLAEVDALVLDAPDVGAFLTGISRLATVLTDADVACGLVCTGRGRSTVIASADPRARRIDHRQLQTGEGPWPEVLRSGTAVEATIHAVEDRWPVFSPVIAGEGVRWVQSLPLLARGSAIGVLNLYGCDGSELSEGQREDARLFAARVAMRLELKLWQLGYAGLASQLEQALASRSVIDQAIGVLMAQQRCSADEALDLLRDHARNNRRRVRDVAATVVFRLTGHRPSSPNRFARFP